jgi:SPP1 gp7 family putative phage head morphogenesis protein
MKLLSSVEKELIKELKSLDFSTAWNVDRIDKQLESVKTINTELHTALYNDLVDQMQKVSVYESEWQKTTVEGSLPIVFDTIAPAPTTITAAVLSKPFQGRLIREWVDKLDDSSYTAIQSAVRQGLIAGESYDVITRKIIGIKPLRYSDGLLALGRNQTQALISTAVAHSVNVARDEFYKSNNDIIQGVQFLATLDFRTTTICKSLDGKVFKIGEGTRPPVHIRCRSTTVPVLKSWKEFGLKEPAEGTRASLNGQVSESINYEQWLRKQSVENQNEALGVGKAELFRGGMPLDRFIDNGKELTLEQLRIKDGFKGK